MQKQEQWSSVEEIATHPSVNRGAIYKWIKQKQIPAYKLEKPWKFKSAEINKWIRAGSAREDTSAE